MSEILRMENFCYTYPDGTVGLKNFSLEVHNNENVILTGNNGSGKTTLLLAVMGILKGENLIRVLGYDPARERKKLSGKVGILFQNPDDQLIMTNVFDDIALGLGNLNLEQEEIRERTESIMEKFEILHLKTRAPHHLSGGEKKKVALVGLLITKPELILLDEPTAHLDKPGKKELFKIINELDSNLIISTHDPDLLPGTSPIIKNAREIHLKK